MTIWHLVPLLLALAGCSGATQNAFAPGVSNIAAQRMRFAAEAICLNNTTARAQNSAARGLNFPLSERDGNTVVYANPGTLTFIRIGPAPDQAFTDDEGRPRTMRGAGCWVGSPAVDTDLANRLVGEILAPRLVDGSDTLVAPLGAGLNGDGGVGFFFDSLAVTLEPARTSFGNLETGEGTVFDHPAILIVHGSAR